jgi:hypothetical protein
MSGLAVCLDLCACLTGYVFWCVVGFCNWLRALAAPWFPRCYEELERANARLRLENAELWRERCAHEAALDPMRSENEFLRDQRQAMVQKGLHVAWAVGIVESAKTNQLHFGKWLLDAWNSSPSEEILLDAAAAFHDKVKAETEFSRLAKEYCDRVAQRHHFRQPSGFCPV